jgi:hypothetical protein
MFAELLAMIAAYTCKRRVETLQYRATGKDKEQAEGKILWQPDDLFID